MRKEADSVTAVLIKTVGFRFQSHIHYITLLYTVLEVKSALTDQLGFSLERTFRLLPPFSSALFSNE